MMKITVLASIVFILCLSLSVPAQTAGENLLEKVEITFDLQGNPTAEAAGFDNPKSNWKIEFQLYLSSWKELKKLGRCGMRETPDAPAYCAGTIDKKLDKRVKKVSRLMAKGKFKRNQLASESDRKIIETINFEPGLIGAFNEAAKVYEKNPVYVFFVKTSISTRSADGKKLRKKFMTEGLHSLKIYKPDNTFDYWNLSKLSYTLIIQKDADGTLTLRKGYTHLG